MSKGFVGILSRPLGTHSIAQARAKALARPQIVEGDQGRAGCSIEPLEYAPAPAGTFEF